MNDYLERKKPDVESIKKRIANIAIEITLLESEKRQLEGILYEQRNED